MSERKLRFNVKGDVCAQAPATLQMVCMTYSIFCTRYFGRRKHTPLRALAMSAAAATPPTPASLLRALEEV